LENPGNSFTEKNIFGGLFDDNSAKLSVSSEAILNLSAVWACKPRDDFFGITKENRVETIDKIINNVVFRLIKNEKNLATQILSLWRKTILKDWKEKYGGEIIGFETFVYGENRVGTIYKADNWKLVGKTQGSAKCKPHGAYNLGERKKTDIKLIFCKLTL
jgi:hypothetical protein